MTVKITKPEINIREKLTELHKPSGIAGKAMLRANTIEEQQSLLGVGRKNLLINGDYQVSQRGTYTSANSVSGGTFYLDRWYSVAANINPTIQHIDVTLPNGQTVKAIRTVATTTATGYCQWRQKLENYEHLRGQYITISAWIRSNKNNNDGFNLAIYDAQAPGGWQYGPEVICDNQWRRYVFTYKVSDTLAQYPEITIQHNNAWQADEYYEVALFQMEIGRVATPFEHRFYGEELALCQRYFEKAVNIEVDPDTTGSNVAYTMIGAAFTTTAVRTQVEFKVTKRTDPSITRVPSSGLGSTVNTWGWYNGAWNAGATSMGQVNTNGFSVDITVSGAIRYQAYLIDGNWYASAEL